MNSKIVLTLSILVIIAGSIFGFIMFSQHREIEALKQDTKPANPLLIENNTKTNSVDDILPESEKVVEDIKDGHWDGDEWHDTSHDKDIHISGDIDKPNDDAISDILKLIDQGINVNEYGMIIETDEYDLLVQIYIDRHRRMYPECSQDELVLTEARQHAKWFLSDKKHAEKIKLIDIESSKIDRELSRIYGGGNPDDYDGDISHFLNMLKTLSDDDKLEMLSNLETLGKRMDELNKRREALYSERVPFENLSHTH